MESKIRFVGGSPIGRDLLIILGLSFLAALTIVSLGGILISQVF